VLDILDILEVIEDDNCETEESANEFVSEDSFRFRELIEEVEIVEDSKDDKQACDILRSGNNDGGRVNRFLHEEDFVVRLCSRPPSWQSFWNVTSEGIDSVRKEETVVKSERIEEACDVKFAVDMSDDFV